MAEEEKGTTAHDASGWFASGSPSEPPDDSASESHASDWVPRESAPESPEDPWRPRASASESHQGAGVPDEGPSESDAGTTPARDPSLQDLSDTPAPSIGPGTTFKREPVEERLARHDQSSVDAMGHDKHRQVVGHSYGPSLARQATLYLVFLLVVAAIAFGVKLLVDKYDQPPKHFAAEAPWAQPGVKQIPPKPLQ